MDLNKIIKELKPVVSEMEDNQNNQEILEKLFKKLINFFSQNNLLIIGAGYSFKNNKIFDYDDCLFLIKNLAKFNMPITAALFTSPRIGLHSILHFDSKKSNIVDDCFRGNKILSFCMSGPEAGSDFFSINTTANKNKFNQWILNGTKKWITGGIYANFYVVLAKTDENKNMNSFSLFLVNRYLPGINVRLMNTQGAKLSGTAYITFDNVVLNNDDVIGEIGSGFHYCMDTLIEERWITGISALAMGYNAFEESLKWSNTRKIHGKPMNKIESVRIRLIEMKALLEPFNSYSEKLAKQLTFARNNNSIDLILASETAIFKAKSTEVATKCIENAQLIFGGRAFEKTGPGSRIQELHSQIHGMKCAGGTYDVLMNFAARIIISKSKL